MGRRPSIAPDGISLEAQADFIHMEFNPFAVPKGKHIWDHYVKFLRRKALCSVPREIFKQIGEKAPSDTELEQLVRLVILFCSEQSPFYNETEYMERLFACSAALGIGDNERVFKMVADGHWWVGDVMSAYFQLENNDVFQSWMALKISAHNQRKYLTMPFSDSPDPDKMMASQQKLASSLLQGHETMANLEARLFPDSKTARTVKESVMADAIGGWAEAFAEDFNFNFLNKS